MTREAGQGSRGLVSEQEQENNRIVQAGSQGPALAGLKRPEVVGVLVVAPGARDAGVRLELAGAVEAALDVPFSRVAVLAGRPAAGGAER